MIFKNFLRGLAAASLLGCAAPPDSPENIERFRALCSELGFQRETQEMAQCILSQIDRASRESRQRSERLAAAGRALSELERPTNTPVQVSATCWRVGSEIICNSF